ncbi:MAG: hypothetical protein MZV64_26880 [Ignavibacteriales bacterium]|nr:hypothetical protein [Ignavibacteriales bacterium]
MGLDTSLFNDMADNGNVNPQKLKSNIFSSILKACDMQEDEIDDISPDAFDKWDIDNIHLIPNAISSFENKELLQEIIKSSITGEYAQFLYDDYTRNRRS